MRHKHLTLLKAPERCAIRLVTSFLALFAITVATVSAQSGRGRIEGIVLDPTGARIPGAVVQVIQTETNSAFDLVTNDQGIYIASSLPVGIYRVVVKKESFATLI